MPVISAKKISYKFFRDNHALSNFLHEAKELNFEKGFIAKREFNALCIKYGIPKSMAYSILSFYKLISFDKPQDFYCKGPACIREKTDKYLKSSINCLGKCDKPPAYFNLLSNYKDKVNIIGKSSLLAPLDLKEYFFLFERILSKSKSDILDLIKKSNLKGRGGANFPTWKKLETFMSKTDPQKALICNADESAPFVFKDRSLMEYNPLSVIFGLYTISYLTDCNKTYIYIRGEYKNQKNILISAYNSVFPYFKTNNFPEIEFVSGGGAYVCGEETALIESLEGKRGEPRKKPPFPFEKGLYDKPTLINNIETIARVFYIAAGNLEFGGKMLYSLSGDVNESGVFEDSCEISIKRAVEVFGKGVKEDKKFGFACVGGASGGFIGKNEYDKKLKDFGVGAFFISHDERNPREVMEYILSFFSEESCGKCLTCANGYSLLLNMIKQQQFDTNKILTIAYSMEKSNLCGLGKTVRKPVVSFLNLFGEE